MRFSPAFEIVATCMSQGGSTQDFDVRTPMADQIPKVVLAKSIPYRRLGTQMF